MAAPARVALLVTCLVDLFRPSIGFAAMKLLEDAGCTVEGPRAQTCCGQPAYNSGDKADAKAIRADFDVLFSVRDEALKALEIARQEKVIGRSEDATITIHAPESTQKLLERYREDLRFLLIVSGVEVVPSTAGNGIAPLRVTAIKAPGGKCERCWFYSTHVGENERYPTVCERCSKALEEIESALPV